MDSNHITDSEPQLKEVQSSIAGQSPPAQPIQQEASIPMNEVENWLRQQLIPYSSRVEKLEETERLKDAKILALESALLTLKTQLEEAIKHKSAGVIVQNAGKQRNPTHPIAGTNNSSTIRPSTTGGKRPSVAQHTEAINKEEPKAIKPVVVKQVTGSPQVGKEIKANSVTSTPVKKDKDSEKKEIKGVQADEDKKGLKDNKSVVTDKKLVEKKPIVRPATTETKENKKVDEKGIKAEEKKTTESNAGDKKHVVAGTALNGKKRETALKDINKDVKDASNEGTKKEKDKATTHVTAATAAKDATKKDTTASMFKAAKNATKEVITGKSTKIDDKKNAVPVKMHKDSGKENIEIKKEEKKNSDGGKKQEAVETKQAEKTEVNGTIVPTATEKAVAAVEVIEKDSSEGNQEVKSTQLEAVSEPSGENTTNAQPTEEGFHTESPADNKEQLPSIQENSAAV